MSPGASVGLRDFDLHGLARLRLVGAGPEEVAAVRRQLGPIEAPPLGDADLRIRFVERLGIEGPLRLVGTDDAAFSDGAFVVLKGRHKTPIRMELPLDRVGEPGFEIRCERGIVAVPHLLALLNLTVVARGGLPLHASAFRHRDADVLVTGWARSGKTELLLGFAAEGAAYVGDEWIYLDASGERITGIPEPIRVWDRDLRRLPAFRRRLGIGERIRLGSFRRAGGWLGRAGAGGGRPPRGWRLGAHRASRVVEEGGRIRLSPERLFGTAPVRWARPDRVVFIASHESAAVRLEPVAPEEVAERMTSSLQEERADLLACHRRFRFAFPERRSALLEGIEERERRRLRSFLAGRSCWTLLHPHPPPIPEMVEAVRPLLSEGGTARGGSRSVAPGRSEGGRRDAEGNGEPGGRPRTGGRP